MHNISRLSSDFLSGFSNLIPSVQLGQILRRYGPARRCPVTVKAQCVVRALIFHLLRGSGTVCENLWLLHGKKLSPSSMTERRQNLPWTVFETIMGKALRPQAQEKKHPEAFYRGWRLVAMDGTQFSVTNTPQILASLSKAASRRLKAAFAKIGAVVLVELGVHNPLAAEIGADGESEMVLAKRLLSRLPAKSLLIADRCYGVGAFLNEFLALYAKRWEQEMMYKQLKIDMR